MTIAALHTESRSRGFSLIELLVVAAIIGLLAGLLLPVISRSKEAGRRAACISNLRQLHLALATYADENNGSFPARTPERRWPGQLESYFRSQQLLACPSDHDAVANPDPTLMHQADRIRRSYVLNGFNDPAVTEFKDDVWLQFVAGPRRGSIMENSISQPAATILFGEKQSSSTAFYADLHRQAGSFLEVLEQARHPTDAGQSSGANPKTGGANYVFADGSVRFLRNGKTVCPLNLWGISDYYRTNYAVCLF